MAKFLEVARMAVYRVFECSNCGHRFESKLDVLWLQCPKCRGRSYPLD